MNANRTPARTLALLTVSLLGSALAHAAPTVKVTADDKTYVLPARMDAGYVQLDFSNTGKAPRDLQIFKLKAGVTAETLQRAVEAFALKGDEVAEAMMNAADLFGGFTDIAPGGKGTLAVNLEPGTYAVSTMLNDGDPKNPKALAAQGYFKTFTVAASAHTADAPKADYKIQLADFALALPARTLTAGKKVWEVVNDGRQPHFLFIAKVQPGKTAEDVMKFLMAGPAAEGAPPLDMIPGLGTAALTTGKSNFITMDLQPGTYFAACFVGDPQTHMPHAMIGMTQFFEVK